MLRFNENNEVIQEQEYRAVLVGLELNKDISYSMQELAGLAEAARWREKWFSTLKDQTRLHL